MSDTIFARCGFDISPYRALIQLYDMLRAASGVASLIVGLLLAGTVMLMSFGISPLLFPLFLIELGIFLATLLVYVYTLAVTMYGKPLYEVSDLTQAGTNANLADATSYDVLHILVKGNKEVENITGQALATSIILSGEGQTFLKRTGLQAEDVTGAFSIYIGDSVTAQDLLCRAAGFAHAAQSPYITIADIVQSIFTHENMRTWLRQFDITEHDIEFVSWWLRERGAQKESRRRWWLPENTLDFMGIGLSWASGYTPFLDRFLRIPGGNEWDMAVGHEQEVEQLMNSLAKSDEANVLLVGQPGVGRFGIVKELIHRIYTGTAHPALNGKRVAYIHLGQIAAMGSSPSEQAAIVTKVLHEMQAAGNIVAVVDGLGSIINGSDGGTVNLSDVLSPFFSSAQVRVVVIMSTDEYHQRFGNQGELTHLFEVVQVPALSRDATLVLMLLTIDRREQKTGLRISYKALREAVDGTESVLPHIPFPEKAFHILEEAVVYAQGKQQSEVTPEIILSLIAQKTGVKQGAVHTDEKQRLLQLEDIIHQRVVNQKQGVKAIVQAMIRARTNVRSRKRPIGTYLFLGPTGVGKTETAKALAFAFFGSDKQLLRIDMSQFQGREGITQLIGDGRDIPGLLTSMIADHPFSVLLLDEYEKADQAVRQLFLPIFDEGYLTDPAGHTYYFTNTLMIATSNAGAELIRTTVQEDGSVPATFEETLRNHILEQNLFQPEELNRFDGVITFTPLTKEHISKIAMLMLQNLNKRLDHEHGISVAITPELVNYLVERGYSPEFGARPMARAIQDSVEYIVARQIVQGNAKPGQVITISAAMLQSIQ